MWEDQADGASPALQRGTEALFWTDNTQDNVPSSTHDSQIVEALSQTRQADKTVLIVISPVCLQGRDFMLREASQDNQVLLPSPQCPNSGYHSGKRGLLSSAPGAVALGLYLREGAGRKDKELYISA
jgi:hypothetical protein